MKVTRQSVAERLGAYLRHEITLAELVNWAEESLCEAELDEAGMDAIRDALARLGLADVRAFGLSWEDCEDLLGRLGYKARLQIEVG